MDTMTVVVSGLVGTVVGGLSKDIIFSWLNIGRKESGAPCTDHQERLGRFEERMVACEEELKKGDGRFMRLETIMDRVDKSVTVLLDRSDRRRVEDHHGV